jgi:hypothetical protein
MRAVKMQEFRSKAKLFISKVPNCNISLLVRAKCARFSQQKATNIFGIGETEGTAF